ncbi:MAG: S41 family peptidase [Pirellulales bacterium]|nr:S41 family peptidase [Pirellulales bacterium]
MPRRNLLLLCVIAVVALACHGRVDRYGRHLAYAMRQIDRRYLRDVDEQDLFEGAVEGMVRRLDERYDDEYSNYVPPKEVQPFEEELNQEFGGIGIEVGLPDETRQLTVTSPLHGSPAYEAGVLAGDRILKIDGQSTQGLLLHDAIERMRGPLGAPVRLTLLHEGAKDPVEVTIVRATIHIDTVLGDRRRADGTWDFLLEGRDRIGYVRITSFTDNTADALRRAVDELVRHDVRGLILDLRGNPGGYLQSAVDVCDMFVDSGVIVTTRIRGGEVFQQFDATADGTFPDFPMAVLVDKGSASASEIVAACLQDHDRAAIVGRRSYGKGTVQEIIPLQPGYGKLKLTTAEYRRPSGKNIHRGKRSEDDADWGVRPDAGYDVAIASDQLVKLLQARRRRDSFRPANTVASNHDEPPVDPQLDKAVEYVEKHKR